MEKKSTKNVRARIFVILLLLLLAAALALMLANCGNIKALYRGLTTEADDIGRLLEQNKKDTAGALSNVGIHVSDDDFDKVNDGSLTEEEIAAIILNGIEAGKTGTEKPDSADTEQTNADVSDSKTPDVTDPPETPDGGKQPDSSETQGDSGQNKPATDGNNGGTGTQTTPISPDKTTPDKTTPTVPSTEVTPVAPQPGKLSDDEYNKKVADLVAKVYVIKANFLATLSSFESKVISEYKALPDEQRTGATKAKIVSDNMSYVAGLEAQCNAQVKAVTDELTALMKENGKDTALVDAINEAYAREKELKKAYYISLYK